MYGYGYRYNSGLVLGAGGGAPFTNTYSLSFDGVDDYVGVDNISSLNNATALTFSGWVKKTSGNVVGFESYVGATDRIILYWWSNNIVYFGVRNGSTSPSASSSLTIYDWNHIAGTFDGATNTIKLYINGVLADTQTSQPSSTSANVGSNFKIGISNGSTYNNGNIDEVSVYNRVLTQEEITSISAAPTDLTDLNPIAWYRMGDNGAYKSPQFLLPNNENKDKVSNYSFELDGIDDYISIANNTTIARTQNISYSIWVNLNATSRQYLIGNTSSSNRGAGLAIESGDNLVFQMGDGTNDSFFNSRVSSFSTYAPLNTWNHILATWDGTDSKIYINGVLRNTWSPTLPYTILYPSAFHIGWRGFGAYKTNGKLDEMALFDSGVSIGDVWDGSGEPIDVSAVSGLTNNWRMGEEATFSGGVWTVPDSAGSNNGTSNAMTIDDRVGEAPNSTSNSVSYNMDEIDRVEDTP